MIYSCLSSLQFCLEWLMNWFVGTGPCMEWGKVCRWFWPEWPAEDIHCGFDACTWELVPFRYGPSWPRKRYNTSWWWGCTLSAKRHLSLCIVDWLKHRVFHQSPNALCWHHFDLASAELNRVRVHRLYLAWAWVGIPRPVESRLHTECKGWM